MGAARLPRNSNERRHRMYSIGFVGIVSFLLAMVLTHIVRSGSVRFGLVDLPDNRRKTHEVPVPRTGGVAIVAAYLLTFVLLLYTPFSGGLVLHSALPFVWRLLPATAMIFATGLLDDLLHLKPWCKLAGQIAA